MPSADSAVASSRRRIAMRERRRAHAPRVAVVAQEDLLEVVVAAADRAHLVAPRGLDERVGRALERDDQMRAVESRPRARRGARAAPRPRERRPRTRPRAAGRRSPAGARASRRRRAGRGAGSRPDPRPARPPTACARRGRRSGPLRRPPRAARGSSAGRAGRGPAIGSSRISSSGSCMNAWIRPSFWRLPVESSRTGRSSCASKRSASSSRTRRSTPPRSAAR